MSAGDIPNGCDRTNAKSSTLEYTMQCHPSPTTQLSGARRRSINRLAHRALVAYDERHCRGLLIFELKLCYLKESGATDEQLMAMAPWVYTDTVGEMQRICPDWDAGVDEEQSDEALQGALIFAARVERLRSHLRLISTMRLVVGKDWIPPTSDSVGQV